MNLEQLLSWLEQNGITVAEKVPQPGGVVFIFTGTRPFPWDGRPYWFALPLKVRQTQVARKEIEALLRHFCHAELAIPRGAPKAAAAGQAIGLQPLHSLSPTDLKN